MKFETYGDFCYHTIIGMYFWIILSLVLFFITKYAPIVIITTLVFFSFVLLDYISYRIYSKKHNKSWLESKLVIIWNRGGGSNV